MEASAAVTGALIGATDRIVTREKALIVIPESTERKAKVTCGGRADSTTKTTPEQYVGLMTGSGAASYSRPVLRKAWYRSRRAHNSKI